MDSKRELIIGEVYTRKELREVFEINDETINTGVFLYKPDDSIWLFVTEEKTPDRTQYRDSLMGDTLIWEGQKSGRTDDLIIRHKNKGLKIALFYRKTKTEFPGAGFVYKGIFEYQSHSDGSPTRFILERVVGEDY